MSLQSAVLCVLSRWRGAFRDNTKNGCLASGNKGLLSLRTGGTLTRGWFDKEYRLLFPHEKKFPNLSSLPAPPPPAILVYRTTKRWACWCANKSCVISSLLFSSLAQPFNRAFSLTWPASMLIYCNKRKFFIRIEFNSHRTGLGHQRGRRLIVTWDQALFSFRFEHYMPAGKAKVAVRENVWEALKLGLISGYLIVLEHQYGRRDVMWKRPKQQPIHSHEKP